MKNRSIPQMILLTIITLGIYFLVWSVKTAREMRAQGAEIPNSFLIIIPFANIWWTWKYSEGVEKVTNNKMSAILTFVLLYVAGFIGIYFIQNEFNQVASVGTIADTPYPTTATPPASSQPEPPVQTPPVPPAVPPAA
jgi:hypothetical protein